MERREIKEVWYNNKHIVLNKELVLYSDGSYERNGIRRYGNSNGNYLKMSLYDIEGKENLSIFQGIGDNFCHTHNLILLCIGCFAIGGIIGYYIFGLLSDIQGKYFVIKIMSIGIIVSMIPICVIANFSLEKNHTLFITLWSVFLVFVGFFLCPLESLLHVYYLELSPTIDFLLPLNGLLYERYFAL